MRNNSVRRKVQEPRPRRDRGKTTFPSHVESAAELRETLDSIKHVLEELPEADNESGAVEKMLRANAILRNSPWPPPFDVTTHRLQLGDARRLEWVETASVHLIVTSPPYWTLKKYETNHLQMGAIADYERFLAELDRVWSECTRVLVPGGRLCCVVGDVCIPRKKAGRHYVMPLHSDIQVRARQFGLDCLTSNPLKPRNEVLQGRVRSREKSPPIPSIRKDRRSCRLQFEGRLLSLPA